MSTPAELLNRIEFWAKQTTVVKTTKARVDLAEAIRIDVQLLRNALKGDQS